MPLAAILPADSPIQAALLATIPVYIIMICGWISRRVNWVTPEMDKGFMRVAIDLCFPCFILDKMFGNDLLRSPLFSLTAAGVGSGFFLLSIAICLLLAKGLHLKNGEGRRTFALTSSLQNYSFFIIPMVALLYSTPGDPTMGVLLTHNVGIEFTLWTVGLMVMSEANKFSIKLLLRGPIIAVLLGLVLVWTKLDLVLIPKFLRTTLQMLGSCAVPLSVFLVGTTFYDLWGKERWRKRIVAGGILARCAILPAIILTLTYFLPVDVALKRVLIFQAAVPSAMIPIVIARHFGGQPCVAIEIVLCTTLVSLISLPFWLSVGFQFIPH